MHYINADSTLAQLCGNGIRCFAKYLVDRGLIAAAEDHLTARRFPGRSPSALRSTRRRSWSVRLLIWAGPFSILPSYRSRPRRMP
ncbi:hypothetical protein C2L71_04850 [Enteroscipio rubneri]|uniref:Diaminopimelate epimerase n=1 Tax=Enteroscipio rubneri TaxID=2070686 RepID=A0A2K2UCV0_9ACTN|nr:hypothetical protein C2L71_04850 [Enteroscipio rubneri]